jgi:lipoprotein-releasing system permease protein
MSFERFISGRYLKAKQQTFISLITLLSIAGVTVGVMALIIVIAVMAGFESDLKNRILGVESHIILMRHGGDFTDYRRVLSDVESTAGVEAATPFVYSQTMLRASGGLSGGVIRGIDPETAGAVIQTLDPPNLERLAAMKAAGGPGGVVLGKGLAGSLGVITGDTIYVISPRGMLSPMGHLPAMKRFKVAGLFESGMYEYDSTLAYMHLDDAQGLLRMNDAVTGIEIRVTDVYKADKLADRIAADLGFPYWSKDWMEMNHNLFSALKLEKTVMFIILALIILVAAFNIASSLIMMVMEKTRDIAILKAMGATDKSIGRIFVYKGMTIGAIGTTLGVLLGFILCMLLKQYKFIELPADVYYITTLPVQLEALDVVLTAGAAMVICYLATLYPARQASRLDPVEALRYG